MMKQEASRIQYLLKKLKNPLKLKLPPKATARSATTAAAQATATELGGTVEATTLSPTSTMQTSTNVVEEKRIEEAPKEVSNTNSTTTSQDIIKK